MKQYKNIEIGERIRVSGWALVHRSTHEPVRSGERVYTVKEYHGASILVTNGTPPQAKRESGVVWCPMWGKEFNVRKYGLKWVKLNGEGEPIF